MQNWIDQAGGQNFVASAVAPAIRGLFAAGKRKIVTFDPQDLNKADLTIASGEEDSLEAVYTKLVREAENTSRSIESVSIEGLGVFRLCDPEGKPGTRLNGRVCLVTGGAQGFGEGIARELAAAGGLLVIADLNLDLAQRVADSLCDEYGDKAAVAIPVDVGDEESVQAMVEETVRRFGGLDLLVSNAGVLRAGGLEEMTLRNFEFVTKINYSAFFLVTKYGSRPMKIQARFDSSYTSDIVQINSKSGLEGSNKNFAYAGGKFGGIGLVQSFAKELVDHRIKVNAICPGNYYEGPLWNDPEKGLFVQYLQAGKVPGAQTVEDVYDFYVAKVPMRRGCSPADVTRAILYCVEQQYETGQAIPVTGGQNMLK